MIGALASCTVMLIAGGGFNADLAPTGAEAIRDLPVSTVELDYRLNDVPGAYRDAAALAAKLRTRPGPLVAYGESAGGAIASWSAAYKRVDAAVTVGSPNDLKLWSWLPSIRAEIGIDGTAWKWSPLRVYEGQRPVFQYHFEVDPFVPPAGQRLRGSRYTLVPGVGHVALDAAGTRTAIRRACKTAASG